MGTEHSINYPEIAKYCCTAILGHGVTDAPTHRERLRVYLATMHAEPKELLEDFKHMREVFDKAIK